MIITPEYIKTLKPYVPGKSIEEIQKEFGLEEIHKIASNENPLGPSPKAIEAMKKVHGEVNRYPDPGALELRKKISAKYGVEVSNIAVGSGSEGIMANILRCFLCDGDEMITSEATFIGFQVLARGRANKCHYVPMPRDTYKFDADGILAKVNERTKIIYICNPNNPTGTILNKGEFDKFYKGVPENVLIIMDEAYFEYACGCAEYPDSMDYRYDNVITLRTFSKIYGIAGARIGYGFAHADIVSTIMKVKLPFEPNSLAQAGAIGALDDDEFLEKSRALNAGGYEYFRKELNDLHKEGKIVFVPSYANFVLLKLESEEKVNFINSSLLKEGVIIRPLKPFGLADCIRVTMGLRKENEAFIKSFKKYI